jgi:hypothetical protein
VKKKRQEGARPAMTNSTDFCFGIVIGVVVAGLLGFVLQQVLFLVKRVQAADKPQKIFHETAQTPSQVVGSSVRAGCTLFILTIVVIAICYLSLVVVE